MSDGNKRGGVQQADLEALARRFHDLWQDQLAAMAADPDFVDMMGRWFGSVATGAPPPGPTPGSFPVPMPGMMTGAAGPFGPLDPAAWLKSLGIEAPDTGAGRNESADDPTAAKAGTASPARTPSATAARRSGDASDHQFERRLADLEQRLDRLEAAVGGARQGAAKGTRKRGS